VVHQDAADLPGGDVDEMHPVVPVDLVLIQHA
jgi:hypothetical protein